VGGHEKHSGSGLGIDCIGVAVIGPRWPALAGQRQQVAAATRVALCACTRESWCHELVVLHLLLLPLVTVARPGYHLSSLPFKTVIHHELRVTAAELSSLTPGKSPKLRSRSLLELSQY
jgi:hypothetical protein